MLNNIGLNKKHQFKIPRMLRKSLTSLNLTNNVWLVLFALQ